MAELTEKSPIHSKMINHSYNNKQVAGTQRHNGLTLYWKLLLFQLVTSKKLKHTIPS